MGTVTINSDIIASRNNDGSIVAMKADDTDLFYKITGVATQVWHYLEEGQQVDEIIKKIAEEFSAEEEKVRSDVDAFIKDLKNFGILE